jgi:hypothetical protein
MPRRVLAFTDQLMDPRPPELDEKKSPVTDVYVQASAPGSRNSRGMSMYDSRCRTWWWMWSGSIEGRR